MKLSGKRRVKNQVVYVTSARTTQKDDFVKDVSKDTFMIKIKNWRTSQCVLPATVIQTAPSMTASVIVKQTRMRAQLLENVIASQTLWANGVISANQDFIH